MKKKVFASVLSADFANIEQEVKRLEKVKVDGLHIDIMDGHFVPNFSMGEKMVATIKKSCNLFLDVHLMIYNPYKYIERFIKVGADKITIHFEATEDIEDTLNYIKRCNKKAGLAFNPETSISMVPKYLDKCDSILFMSVNPGFGGQNFLDNVLEKIEFTKDLLDKHKKAQKDAIIPLIEVDGGINQEKAKKCFDAGVDTIISGSYLFSQKDIEKTIRELKK